VRARAFIFFYASCSKKAKQTQKTEATVAQIVFLSLKIYWKKGNMAKKTEKNNGVYIKNIAQNRKARHDYEVIDSWEAGIELTGTEVKSIRAGKINISDSFAEVKKGQLWLHNLHISPYDQGNRYNHESTRQRRLLMHKKQIEYLLRQTDRQPQTLIPLSIYFKKQYVKIQIGLCRGLKKYDKRQKIAEEESKRRLAALKKLR
jgi:SsrA-binding protein